eukprot:TRINITY_DN2096_c0_g1_i11.p2 TRINITY_DN2096_c0_g1~~TRINITY_DN2096_c0_g1_i11.p2  ORF type:complete len:475 (-),score=206.44 TRINITY_DN2096_c0_g1_i11:2164-3588(-)
MQQYEKEEELYQESLREQERERRRQQAAEEKRLREEKLNESYQQRIERAEEQKRKRAIRKRKQNAIKYKKFLDSKRAREKKDREQFKKMKEDVKKTNQRVAEVERRRQEMAEALRQKAEEKQQALEEKLAKQKADYEAALEAKRMKEDDRNQRREYEMEQKRRELQEQMEEKRRKHEERMADLQRRQDEDRRMLEEKIAAHDERVAMLEEEKAQRALLQQQFAREEFLMKEELDSMVLEMQHKSELDVDVIEKASPEKHVFVPVKKVVPTKRGTQTKCAVCHLKYANRHMKMQLPWMTVAKKQMEWGYNDETEENKRLASNRLYEAVHICTFCMQFFADVINRALDEPDQGNTAMSPRMPQADRRVLEGKLSTLSPREKRERRKHHHDRAGSPYSETSSKASSRKQKKKKRKKEKKHKQEDEEKKVKEAKFFDDGLDDQLAALDAKFADEAHWDDLDDDLASDLDASSDWEKSR